MGTLTDILTDIEDLQNGASAINAAPDDPVLANKTIFNFPENDFDIQHMIRFGLVDFRDRTTFDYNSGPADLNINGATTINKASIFLPIPDNVQVAYAPTWDFVELELYSAGIHKFGKVVNAIKQSVADPTHAAGLLNPFNDPAALLASGENALLYAASRVTRSVGASDIADSIELSFRSAYNPFREAIFRGVSNRSFNFSWNLFPRNQRDCETIQQILHVLKFQSMPAITPDSLLFEYPGEFTINFYSKNVNGAFVENPNLPKIGFCVCSGIDTNFTSNGIFSALKNGHPVDVVLTLQFTEIEIVTKQKVAQGY